VCTRILFIDVYGELRVLLSRMIDECRANPLPESRRIDEQHFDLCFVHANGRIGIATMLDGCLHRWNLIPDGAPIKTRSSRLLPVAWATLSAAWHLEDGAPTKTAACGGDGGGRMASPSGTIGRRHRVANVYYVMWK
jgi:hypothetical protein